MSDMIVCPRCGQPVPIDSPDGLCPVCLLNAGLVHDESLASHSKQSLQCGVDLPLTTPPHEPIPTTSPQDVPATTPGAAIIGRTIGGYEILEEIARGGMGVVYKARQKSLQRIVALKMILIGPLASEQEIKRFKAEAEAAALLDHPNIVPVYEVDEWRAGQSSSGIPYFSMKLIDGLSLAQTLNSPRWIVGNKDSQNRAARLLAQVARALHYAHQRGILHRDLKPGNILLDVRDEPHITDLGLAKRVTTDEEESARGLTQSGAIVGTPSYMAPEQARAVKQLSTAADVYGLGAVLYEALTGRPPFQGDSAMETLLQLLERDPIQPRVIEPGIDPDLETICLKCLEKDPRRRYGSAEALAEDLERWLNGEPITARPASAAERVLKWIKRSPAIAGLLTALVFVAIGGVAGIYWKYLDAREQERKAWHLASEKEIARAAEEIAKNKATGETHAKEEALQKEEAATDEKRTLLGKQYVANGAERLEKGDLSGALLWFAEALRHDHRDDTRAKLHRIRLATVLRQCPVPLHVCFHEDKVNDASYSPDGKRFITAGEDKTARIWDTVSGEPVVVLEHQHPVARASFSADGKRVLTLSGTISGPQPLMDWEVRLWETDTGKLIAPPRRHVAPPFLRPGYEPMFSPDGKRVLLHSDARTAEIVDAETGQAVGKPLEHEGYLASARFNPQGTHVVTVRMRVAPPGQVIGYTIDERCVIQMWDARTGQPDGPAREFPKFVQSIAFVGQRTHLLTSAGGKTVVWDPSSGQTLWSLPDFHLYSASSDGRRVSLIGMYGTGSDGRRDSLIYHDPRGLLREIMVWDTGAGKKLCQLPEPLGGFGRGELSAFSPDGRWLLAAARDNTARVWNAADARPLTPPLPHDAPVERVAFSPEGQHILTVSADHVARIWSATSGEAVGFRLQHEGTISSAQFSPDGSQILVVSGPTVRSWPVTTPLRHLGKDPLPAGRARLSPDGQHVLSVEYTAQREAVVMLRNIKKGEETVVTRVGAADVLETAFFSSTGQKILVVTRPKQTNLKTFHRVRVWETASCRAIGEIQCRALGSPIAVTSDGGRVLIEAGADLHAYAEDVGAKKPLPAVKLLRGVGGATLWGRFSLDGKRMLVVEPDYTKPGGDEPGSGVHICEAEGKTLAVLRPAAHLRKDDLILHGHVLEAAFSPDGSRVLTVVRDGTVQVWDSATGKPVTPQLFVGRVLFSGAFEESTTASFSPDGRRILAAGGGLDGSGQARVWDAVSGKPLTPFLRHEGQVRHTAFSADGRRLVTASNDGTARVWDAFNGEPVTPFLKHSGKVGGAWFSADGRRLFTLCDPPAIVLGSRIPREAQVWDVETGQPLTPPLKGSGAVTQIGKLHGVCETHPGWFSDDGRRLLLLRRSNKLEVIDLEPEGRSLGELLAEAELLSARRVSPTGSVVPLEVEPLRRRWPLFRKAHPPGGSEPMPNLLALHDRQLKECMAPKKSPREDAPPDPGAEMEAPAAALWHLERLFQLLPSEAKNDRNKMNRHLMRSLLFTELGEWDAVVAESNILLALGQQGVDLNQKYFAWYHRGVAHAHLGKWKEAEEDFARSVQPPAAPLAAWSALALVRLHLGDQEGYQKACAGLFQHHAKKPTPPRGLPVLRACTVGPNPLNHYGPFLEMAEKPPPRKGESGPTVDPVDRAAVYFRAGRHKEALQLLEQTKGAAPATPRYYFLLAIARHQAGDKEKSREALYRGVSRQEQLQLTRQEESPGKALRFWHERLEERLLRREAEGLFQVKKP